MERSESPILVLGATGYVADGWSPSCWSAASGCAPPGVRWKNSAPGPGDGIRTWSRSWPTPWTRRP